MCACVCGGGGGVNKMSNNIYPTDFISLHEVFILGALVWMGRHFVPKIRVGGGDLLVPITVLNGERKMCSYYSEISKGSHK